MRNIPEGDGRSRHSKQKIRKVGAHGVQESWLGPRLKEELLSKAWKDAAYGAMLLIDPERDGIVQILHDAGVAESPLGRVFKQNPDRTVSAEGRPINDMRTQNAKGSKYNHPPAPQPRHQAVARQSCGGTPGTLASLSVAPNGMSLGPSSGTSSGCPTSPSLRCV